MRHAVIVAGHAILRRYADPYDASNWVLLDFQRHECGCYVEHVRAAVEEAAADPDALLVITGGQSRAEAGPRSEAQSYLWIAEHFEWWGHADVARRVITEELARDSFENLLFGICRFKEYTGRLPEMVTMVSWRFKERRFSLHRAAMGWPDERYRYRGPNDPPGLAQALAAEARNAAAYETDPYSRSAEFAAKREARNPFRRTHAYRLTCPELFEWDR